MRRIALVFLAFFSFFQSARAWAAAPPDSAAFLRTSTAALTLEEVLTHFELYDRDLRSLSARFTQSMKASQTGFSSQVEGTVAYRKPERLRIEHVRPERQTVVSDGKDIWIHRHAHAQVIQSDLADWKNADPAVANLMQFGSYAKMLKAYDVVLASGTLTLTPKDSKAGFTLRLELDAATLFPKTTALTAGAVEVRTEFDAIKFNPELEEKSFLFVPPPGTDVFRNFKPPRFER